MFVEGDVVVNTSAAEPSFCDFWNSVKDQGVVHGDISCSYRVAVDGSDRPASASATESAGSATITGSDAASPTNTTNAAVQGTSPLIETELIEDGTIGRMAVGIVAFVFTAGWWIGS
jgi:hypothetical protein